MYVDIGYEIRTWKTVYLLPQKESYNTLKINISLDTKTLIYSISQFKISLLLISTD